MPRIRKRRTSRPVPHTVGGQTYMVEEPHETLQVVQPVDLDQVIRTVLTVITFVVVLGALTWSTVAIGGLLSSMAPPWVSFTVAVVFDLTWVACMAAEWLMRYDRSRARTPRRAGWAALAVSVAAITAHGTMLTGEPVIGSVGGVVSVLAKGLWMVNMLISARRLSPLDQQWYEKAASAADAQLALAVAERKLARTQSRVQQERAALQAFRSQPEVASAEPFQSEPPALEDGSHDPVVYVIRNGNRVKIGTTTHLRNRVRALSLRQSDVLLTVPGGPDKERDLHQRFADHRIGTSEWFSFVQAIRDFVRDPDGPVPAPVPDEVPAPVPSRPVPASLGDKQSLSARALELVLAGDKGDEDIKDILRDEFRDKDGTPPLPNSINKAVSRARDKASRAA